MFEHQRGFSLCNMQEKLRSTLDRMNEAHFWLHSMEDLYHHADQFRWCFNAFLRAFKEIPQIITMELQTDTKAAKWFKSYKKNLYEDPLIKALSKNRDFIVHKAMLLPESNGTIGLSNGSKMKFGVNYKIHPLDDSDKAMHDYLLETEDIFGILHEDEDVIPCVGRSWKIKEFDDELANLCARAWITISNVICDAFEELGETVPPHDLSCRHSRRSYSVKFYTREELRKLISDHK